MQHAFPEDELKPLSCVPLTRDRINAGHIEVNDVLGNYSLTLIDSLSTLAILASSPDTVQNLRDPLVDFQRGIEALVEHYGDGTVGAKGQGKRSRGFDLDSKVQVFETVIRGVGGLLSAHLFASGDLPIRKTSKPWLGLGPTKTVTLSPQWSDGFQYDGQLLRLATDLADRLVPAFYTNTGLPYPRVNLRHGVPFYANSPLNAGSTCENTSGPLEITETCSAGAGSLVLEFTTLSRLTDIPLYEDLAKKAFWAVWERRSDLDLLGAGVDAESGQWVSNFAGIGAGIDSFFEYALKTHILVSGVESNSSDSDDFLTVWQDAHAGIKRHLYRDSNYQHPHYIQSDLHTGASKAFWIDSLSAYYPGLLTLGGELEEAIETHLLYTALWTRYAALPERWSPATGTIDAGLRWWGGRPEFIESTWYLYRATRDPFYLHVGEMTLHDIQRRCWTNCGWAGLEDVRTGELKDRMESFFLGETAKYLFLIFDTDHPLNTLDASFVFTTEGHPLVLPPRIRTKGAKRLTTVPKVPAVCPTPPKAEPFTISAVASRLDLFHAARLARLHQIAGKQLKPSPTVMESSYNEQSLEQTLHQSPNNNTFYPWTLPPEYIPAKGMSSKMALHETFDLLFPTLPNATPGAMAMTRTSNGILLNALSALKVNMVRDVERNEHGLTHVYRVHSVGLVNLGRDERVLLVAETASDLNPVDPYFTRHKNIEAIDLVLDTPDHQVAAAMNMEESGEETVNQSETRGLFKALLQQVSYALDPGSVGSVATFLQNAQDKLRSTLQDKSSMDPANHRPILLGALSTGPGAGPLPDVPDASFVRQAVLNGPMTRLSFWTNVYFADRLCDSTLPSSLPRQYQVLVVRRGGCSFSEKMRNIPSFAPGGNNLQLVIVVNFEKVENPKSDALVAVRPLLDQEQTTPSGIRRPHPIPMVMVDGGDETWQLLHEARGIGIRRKYWYESQGLRITNLDVL